AVQGVLCEGDSRQSHLLGLVRHRLEGGGQEYALFLYTHRRMAITGDDVSLDQIVPVSRDFSLEEVSSDGELYILGSDVTVQLDTAELSLVFQLPFGSHTRTFLQEVARACPGRKPLLGQPAGKLVTQVLQAIVMMGAKGLGFEPATPDPEFLWLSPYRCTKPRGWNSAPGTCPVRVRIGRDKCRSPKERWGLEKALLQGAVPILSRGGAMAHTCLRLVQVARGGRAPLGAGRAGRRGQCDEELEEAGREMSAASDSRERDSAGPEGGGELGCGSGPGQAAVPTFGRAGSVDWRVDAWGRDQGPGPSEAGTLGLMFRGNVSYS
ncbi:Type II inositol 1,4,5-trisphosphate 5-phosphatase, partial [Galemys pyrenaicus]